MLLEFLNWADSNYFRCWHEWIREPELWELEENTYYISLTWFQFWKRMNFKILHYGSNTVQERTKNNVVRIMIQMKYQAQICMFIVFRSNHKENINFRAWVYCICCSILSVHNAFWGVLSKHLNDQVVFSSKWSRVLLLYRHASWVPHWFCGKSPSLWSCTKYTPAHQQTFLPRAWIACSQCWNCTLLLYIEWHHHHATICYKEHQTNSNLSNGFFHQGTWEGKKGVLKSLCPLKC